jgi:hypothetical protein
VNTVIAWLVAFITAVNPPGSRKWLPAAEETAEDASARYESIAEDLASIVWDRDNPPFFKGPFAREKTASVMLATMKFESQFRRDVDLNIGSKARGDGGDSYCLLQIDVGKGRTQAWNQTKHRFKYKGDPSTDVIIPGFTGDELIADRKNCLLTAYRYMRVSFQACSALPVEERLALYASGSCDRGHDASAIRMKYAKTWYSKHAPTFNDEEAFILFAPPAEQAGTTLTSIVTRATLAVDMIVDR